jgi:hypothetical protein
MKSDVPSGEVAPGLCRFDCNVCMCNCQVTFDKCKCQTIANGAERNAAKSNKMRLMRPYGRVVNQSSSTSSSLLLRTTQFKTSIC